MFQLGNNTGQPIHYPTNSGTVQWVKRATDCVSPVIGQDLGLAPPPTECDELDEFVAVRKQVEAGEFPLEYLVHSSGMTLGEYDQLGATLHDYFVTVLDGAGNYVKVPKPFLEAAADACLNKGIEHEDPKNITNALIELASMDDPTDLGDLLTDFMISKGEIPISMSNANDFVGRRNMFGNLAKASGAALRVVFLSKYFTGRPRPIEEILEPAAVGLENVVHPGAVTPKHPAYGAGHGAVAGRTLVELLEQFPNASPEVVTFLTLCCKWFAHLRTPLGVHWPSDNDAGLKVGLASGVIEKEYGPLAFEQNGKLVSFTLGRLRMLLKTAAILNGTK